MRLKKTFVTATTALALSAAPMALIAQEAAPQTQEAPAEQAQFSDAQLDSWVDAAMEVQQLRQDFVPRIQAAEDEDAAQELRSQAQQEMLSAVEETEGMTVETYTAIGETASTDTELGARLNARIEDRMPQPNSDG